MDFGSDFALGLSFDFGFCLRFRLGAFDIKVEHYSIVKRKYEYIEGQKARKNFEEVMHYAFGIPKEKAPPKRKPRRHRKSGKDGG